MLQDGVLSPAFLQAACAKAPEVQVLTLKALQADPTITSVSCNGEITVASTKNGAATTQTYTDLSAVALSVSADIDTQFTITGDCTINTMGTEAELVIQ